MSEANIVCIECDDARLQICWLSKYYILKTWKRTSPAISGICFSPCTSLYMLSNPQSYKHHISKILTCFDVFVEFTSFTSSITSKKDLSFHSLLVFWGDMVLKWEILSRQNVLMCSRYFVLWGVKMYLFPDDLYTFLEFIYSHWDLHIHCNSFLFFFNTFSFTLFHRENIPDDVTRCHMPDQPTITQTDGKFHSYLWLQ